MTSTAVRGERLTVHKYPWDKWPSGIVEVKPNEWTWIFNLVLGEPRPCPQDFEHKRDSEGVSVSRRSVGQPHNPDNFPRIPFDFVKQIFDLAHAQDTSLKRVFIKLFDRRKLSDEQIEVLATAPDLYIANPSVEDVTADAAERSERAKAFLAEVDGTQKQAAPKLKGQPVAAAN